MASTAIKHATRLAVAAFIASLAYGVVPFQELKGQSANEAWLALACPEGAQGQILGGLVLDSNEAARVEGAVVQLQHLGIGNRNPVAITTTNGQGRYAFCGIEGAGPVTLRAHAGGAASQTLAIAPAGLRTWTGDLLLTQDPRSTLLGRVFDPKTASPVADAVVEIPALRTRVRAGADGCFRFQGLAPGPLTIVTHHPDYGSVTDSITILGADTADVGIPMGEDRALVRGPVLLNDGEVSWGPDLRILPTRSTELLQADSPDLNAYLEDLEIDGLRVSGSSRSGYLCVEPLRPSQPGCQMVDVLWDGDFVPGPGRFLSGIVPATIANLSVLNADEAQQTFCFRGNYGALVTSTRQAVP